MATPEPDHFLAAHQLPPSTTPQDILKIVWDRFYQWDEESCRALLSDLRSKQPNTDGPSELENTLGSFTPCDRPDGDADEFFDVADYDEDGDQLEEEGLLSVSIIEKEPTSRWVIHHWKPNPRYLACTPLSANIFVPHDTPTSCSFPPLSDDPAFQLDSFMALYNRFTWQYDFKDPAEVPEIRELKPTVPTTEFEKGREPCSNSCFRLIRDDAELDDDAFNYLHWQEAEDLEMLRNMLKLAPDALPCDLAIICRKPCDQVFANRKSLFPDEDILDERCEDPPLRFQITQFADVKNENEKAWET
ncbi:hypothetical protein MD484_g2168, partial [Candolleomyces efflorescens]